MIRTHEWKYSVFRHPRTGIVRRELFHLQDDPWELRNLADDGKSRPVLVRLEKQLKEHLERTDDRASLDEWPALA
jgi:arylsulfatase A-like enzyme